MYDLAGLRLTRACYLSQADPVRTRSQAEEAYALSRAVGFKQITAYALSLLGLLDLQRGEETLAQSHLEEALRLQTELWHQYGIAWAMYDLAGLRLAQRDYPKARTAYEEGLQRSMAVGDQMLVASCLEGLAAAVVTQAGEEGAVPIALWAARLSGTPRRLRARAGSGTAPGARADVSYGMGRGTQHDARAGACDTTSRRLAFCTGLASIPDCGFVQTPCPPP